MLLATFLSQKVQVYQPIKTIARQVLRLEFMNLLGIYTVGVARSLYRRLLLDVVIVNCP